MAGRSAAHTRDTGRRTESIEEHVQPGRAEAEYWEVLEGGLGKPERTQ